MAMMGWEADRPLPGDTTYQKQTFVRHRVHDAFWVPSLA